MHAIRMDIIMVVIAAAVMTALPFTPVDVPTVTAVMEKSHVTMIAATMIALAKMMTN